MNENKWYKRPFGCLLWLLVIVVIISIISALLPFIIILIGTFFV